MPWRGRPERLLVAAIAAATVAAAALSGQLEHAIWLVPLYLLALPLAGGRYLGERKIGRLRPRSTRYRTVALRRPLPRTRAVLPRGGRLMGRSLAVRPPPAPLAF